MNDDLSDVGLNALEALEAQDEQDTSDTGEDTGIEVEEDTSETVGQETGAAEDTSEENDDEANENGEDAEGNNSEGTEATEDENKSNNDKELSDEEFEELAKKRGYTKAPSEEEKAKADEQNRAREETMARLMACPKEVDEELWENLPEENKIIYNSLPYLAAEGKNGTIHVKTPDQLPEDFVFKNARAEMKFQNDLQAQETKATQMANALSARSERGQRETAQRQEAVRVISEIEGLQKTGALPTPKAKNGTPEFDTDPAVTLINKVLDYRAMRRAEGAMLSVRDSLLLFKAEHPEEFQKKEAKGDVERRNIAKKVAGNNKATGTAVNKNDNKPQYYKVGMSTEDVLDRILDEMD